MGMMGWHFEMSMHAYTIFTLFCLGICRIAGIKEHWREGVFGGLCFWVSIQVHTQLGSPERLGSSTTGLFFLHFLMEGGLMKMKGIPELRKSFSFSFFEL